MDSLASVASEPREAKAGRWRITRTGLVVLSVAPILTVTARLRNKTAESGTDSKPVTVSARDRANGSSLKDQIKALWDQGAEAKQAGRFGEAAAVWSKALQVAPTHAGFQSAIAKLPVEATYVVEAPTGAKPEQVVQRISYFDQKGRLTILKNVPLPWKLKVQVPKGQSLSVRALVPDAAYPLVCTIAVGSSHVVSASSFTAWWLGYSYADVRCSEKANYSQPLGVHIQGDIYEVNAPNPQDDAEAFKARLKQVLSDKSALLVSEATVVQNTDILLLTLPETWSQVSSADRLAITKEFYDVWRKIHKPVYTRQDYLMMVDASACRAGGSRYPDGSQLWAVNQGDQGDPVSLPEASSAAPDQPQPDQNSGSSSSDQSNVSPPSGSEIDTYRRELADMSGMDRFVASVEPMPYTKNTVKILVTDEFNEMNHHLRLELAQHLLEIWMLIHTASDRNTASIVLQAGDGTTVGGQQLTGSVWVED